MDNLFSVSATREKNREIGYIDQYIYSNYVNSIVYLSGYCYDSCVHYFKDIASFKKHDSTPNLFIKNAKEETNLLSCTSRGNVQAKSNKIPNTDISNVIMYYKNGEYNSGKKVIIDKPKESLVDKIIYIKLSDIIEDMAKEAVENNMSLPEFLDNPWYSRNKITPILRRNASIRKLVGNIIKSETTFPYIEEWTDFVFDNCPDGVVFHPCSAMYADINNQNNVYAFAINIALHSIQYYISTALSQGQLTIHGSNTVSKDFENTSSLTDYLNRFSSILIDKTANRFSAVFDPNKESFNQQELNYFDYTKYNSSLQLFNTQKKVIGAVSRTLDKERAALVVGEMGTGKTAMAIGSVYLNSKHKNTNNIIMCPGHLVEKWKREVERLYPGAVAKIIGSMDDLFQVEHIIKDKNRRYPLFLVISKDTAKISYNMRPSAVFDKINNQFICPDCGNYLVLPDQVDSKSKPSKIIINGKTTFRYKNLAIWKAFLEENKSNHGCLFVEEKQTTGKDKNGTHTVNYSSSKYSFLYNKTLKTCNCSMWTATTSSEDSPWKKYPGAGYIHDDMIDDIKTMYNMIMDKTIEVDPKQKAFVRKLYNAIVNAEELGIKKNAPKRYSIARYIRQRFKGLIDYFIADEVHMYSSSKSAQANAFGDFVKTSKKTIALTGTLLNGYADSIYYILFRMFPKTFKENGYTYDSTKSFVQKYGVEETTIKTTRRVGGDVTNTTKTKKTCPGVSPKLFTEFLLDKAIFVSLADMSTGLPSYKEIPVPVFLSDNVNNHYIRILREIRNYMGNNHNNTDTSHSYNDSNTENRQRNKFTVALSAAQKLGLYPDQPYDMSPIFEPDETNKILVEFPDAIDDSLKENYCSPKDQKTLEIVREKIEKGENVLIYIDYVNKTNCVSRLEKMFKLADIKSCTLTSSVPAKDREEWIDTKVRNGCRVMICNPRLVETGLDLLSFTNIIFYQVGYNLFTMRQASRRSLRLNQPNNVNVYFLYFQNTVQEMVLSLMANKLQAAMAIEGKFSEEGLAAMSNNDTILTKLANSLIEDIEYKIEEGDFSSSFEAEEDDGSRFKMVYILDKQDTIKKYSLFNNSKRKKKNIDILKKLAS